MAQTQGVPAYVVADDRTLGGIAAARPGSVGALLEVPGMGRSRVERYGDDVLRIEPGTARALIYVICAEIREVFGFELSEEALRNFSETVDKYCGDRLEKKYCRHLFLKELQ